MTIDDFQKYLHKLSLKISKRADKCDPKNTEYIKALRDISNDITQERESLLTKYEELKSLGLV